MGVVGVTAAATYSLTYAADASDGAQTIVLAGAGTATNQVTLSVVDAGTAVTDVTINAASGVNNVLLDGDLDLTEELTIVGSGALVIDTDTTGFTALTALAAASYTGDLEIDIGGSTDVESVTTGSGDDSVTMDGDLFVAGATLAVDLGAGSNTIVLTNIDTDVAIGTLVFTDDDLTVSGISTLVLNNAITLAANATLDLDGIAPSALEVVGAVTMAGNDLVLSNTGTELGLTFIGALNSAAVGSVLDLGDTAETVSITAEAAIGATEAITVAGEALASLTLNIEDNADIDVGLTEEALESIVINATGDVGATTITSTISGNAADEFSLTSLTLSDETDDGDTTIDITLIDTVSLISINLSGGEATDFDINALLALFDGAITVNIGDFGVDADGATAGGLLYTTDDTNAVRETFVFTGDNIGDISIDGYNQNAGGNGDRLDFSQFAGLTSIAQLDFVVTVGGDTEITSDAFDGTITIVGVDNIGVNTYNFVF